MLLKIYVEALYEGSLHPHPGCQVLLKVLINYLLEQASSGHFWNWFHIVKTQPFTTHNTRYEGDWPLLLFPWQEQTVSVLLLHQISPTNWLTSMKFVVPTIPSISHNESEFTTSYKLLQSKHSMDDFAE